MAGKSQLCDKRVSRGEPGIQLFFAALNSKKNTPNHPAAVAVGTTDRFGFPRIFPERKHQFEVEVALLTMKLVGRHYCPPISNCVIHRSRRVK
jgi:hypothetical protein